MYSLINFLRVFIIQKYSVYDISMTIEQNSVNASIGCPRKLMSSSSNRLSKSIRTGPLTLGRQRYPALLPHCPAALPEQVSAWEMPWLLSPRRRLWCACPARWQRPRSSSPMFQGSRWPPARILIFLEFYIDILRVFLNKCDDICLSEDTESGCKNTMDCWKNTICTPRK